MKTILIPLSITVMLFSVLFASCGPERKMQRSAQSDTKVKKDSSVISAANTDVAKTENRTTATAMPVDVKDNFANRYPLAKNSTWYQTKDASNNKTNYTVSFEENNKNTWIIYSDKGDVIEERQEIQTDQLPQNIYNVIKEKYPMYKIASATTYKHINKDGSYAVMLKPVSENDKKQLEVLFRENGTIVE